MKANIRDLLKGEWTYRSFLNRVEPASTLEDILFGEGTMHVELDEEGHFTHSTLELGSDYPMTLQGGLVETDVGAPPTVRLSGYGMAGTKTAGWVYSYVGFVAPAWPYGVKQRPALVGTVTRVVPHDGAPAGFVASFVAVKHC